MFLIISPFVELTTNVCWLHLSCIGKRLKFFEKLLQFSLINCKSNGCHGQSSCPIKISIFDINAMISRMTVKFIGIMRWILKRVSVDWVLIWSSSGRMPFRGGRMLPPLLTRQSFGSLRRFQPPSRTNINLFKLNTYAIPSSVMDEILKKYLNKVHWYGTPISFTWWEESQWGCRARVFLKREVNIGSERWKPASHFTVKYKNLQNFPVQIELFLYTNIGRVFGMESINDIILEHLHRKSRAFLPDVNVTKISKGITLFEQSREFLLCIQGLRTSGRSKFHSRAQFIIICTSIV